jgi:hypothetical protein
MKKIIQFIGVVALLATTTAKSQVSAYSFTQSLGAYSAITGGTVFGSTTSDDQRFVNPAVPLGGAGTTGIGLPIGFNFTYNGNIYDRFGINNNGWIALGNSTITPNPINLQNSVSNYEVISATSTAPALLQNRIGGFSKDLQGQTGSELRAQTIGVSPNQTLVIQWTNYRAYVATGDIFNFQIQLLETSNVVKISYGTFTTTNVGTVELGLRGNSNADFNNRNVVSGTSTWATSIAGTFNTSNAAYNSTLTPVNGQIYSWSPPNICSGTPAANSVVASATTICPNGAVSLNLANSYSSTGLAYQWATSTNFAGPYTAVVGATNTIYSASNVTATAFYQAVITCTNGASSTTATPVQVTIGGNPCQCNAYCATSAPSATGDDEIFNVSIGTLNNSSTCGQTGGPTSTLNIYSNYTGIVAAPNLTGGSSYTLNVTVGQCSGSAYSGGVTVYMDFNNNGSFADAGEQVYASPSTLWAVAGTLNSTVITIPVGITPGITRMRVIAEEFNVGTAPCAGYGYGETEDYCINLIAPPLCSGAPSSGTITGVSSLCVGNTGTNLSLSGATSGLGISYQWQSSSAPGGPYVNMGSVLTQTTGSLSSTMYYIATTSCSTSGSISSTPEFTLTVNPLPVILVTSSSTNICLPSAGPINLSATGANSYTWGPAASLSSSVGANVTATPTANISYSVLGTNTITGCSSNTNLAISVNSSPVFSTIIASPSTICSGATSSLQTLATSSEYVLSAISYSAIPSVGATTLCNNGTASVPLTSGTLDDGGWASIALPFTFGFTGITTNSVGISTNGFIYMNSGAPPNWTGYNTALPSTFANNPTFGAIYSDLQFGNAGSKIEYFTTGTTPNQKFVVNWSGQFYFGSGTVTTQAILYETTNVLEVHTFTSTGTNNAVQGIQNTGASYALTVPGRNNNLFAVTTPDAYRFAPMTITYSWTPSSFLSATNVNNPIANAVTSSIVYTVSATGSNGCSATNSVGINVNPLPILSITGSTSICQGNTATLTASGADSYTWSTGPATTSITETPTVNTTYTASGTSTLTGCVGLTAITVTVNTPPSVTVTASNNTVCAGSNATISALGAGSYTWNTGANTTSIVVSPSVTSTYTISGVSFGCASTSTASSIINVNALPSLSLTPSTATTCINAGTIALIGSPAGGTYSGTNVSGSVFAPATAGTFNPVYAFTSSLTGCSNTISTSVVVSPCTGLSSKVSVLENISVYPNPSTGLFNVELPAGVSADIILTDVSGKTIKEVKSAANTTVVDISKLANGLYYVKIESAQGSTVAKIVKQ